MVVLLMLDRVVADEQCVSLCHDGSEPTRPDRNVTEMLIYNPGGTFSGLCRDVAQLVLDEPGLCSVSRFVAGMCGCPPLPDQCQNFCYNQTMPDPDRMVGYLANVGVPIVSCRDLGSFVEQTPRGSSNCKTMLGFGALCDCPEDDPYFYYLGATTQTERVAIAWIPRISGILSAICSIIIIVHVIRTHGTQYNVYHELLMSMSIFDIIGSIAWAFSTFPIPDYDENGDPTGVYGSSGSKEACTAQGFFVQLGFTGIYYNMALSFYYLLVIRYGWKEDRLRACIWRFHVLPLLVGFGLAFGGIPYYEHSFWGCWILPEPHTPSFVQTIVFFIVPLATVLLVASINMLLVYLAVHHQDEVARKYSIANVGRSRKRSIMSQMERAVFWQCLFYLGALYITWPILLVSQFLVHTASFGFWVVIFVLAPSQGVWNSIVYLRPRCIKQLQSRRSVATPNHSVVTHTRTSVEKETVEPSGESNPNRDPETVPETSGTD